VKGSLIHPLSSILSKENEIDPVNAKAVFEILMRENAEMLLAFLRTNVIDAHAVDDLFQETMIVAWRKLEEFDQQRSFGKWLRGIAGKLVLAHYRTSRQHAMAIDQSTLEWLESRFAQIQSLKGDSFVEKLELLRQCVQSLPDKYRDAVTARYHHQMTLEQMVSTLDVARETIKKRLVRAKSKLGNCIQQKLLALEAV
jgi:RNA polymerase sigma factor (sigma-70 family)